MPGRYNGEPNPSDIARAVGEQSPEDIENLRVEKLKERDALRDSLHVVQLEKLDLEKTLVEYRKKISEGRHAISRLNCEIEILEMRFWQARGK
jgi:hypothetical protein